MDATPARPCGRIPVGDVGTNLRLALLGDLALLGGGNAQDLAALSRFMLLSMNALVLAVPRRELCSMLTSAGFMTGDLAEVSPFSLGRKNPGRPKLARARRLRARTSRKASAGAEAGAPARATAGVAAACAGRSRRAQRGCATGGSRRIGYSRCSRPAGRSLDQDVEKRLVDRRDARELRYGWRSPASRPRASRRRRRSTRSDVSIGLGDATGRRSTVLAGWMETDRFGGRPPKRRGAVSFPRPADERNEADEQRKRSPV